MSTPYTIGPHGPIAGSGNTAILQPGRPHGPVTIFNTGQATVYLDNENQQVNPTDGLPLTAGSSIPWDKDLPLFASCPTSTTIVVSDNGAIPFDAGAIANQLNLQGLPGLIAQQISISGAPPIDAFQAIGTPMQVVSNGSLSPVLDMRTFQSLFVALTNTGGMIAGQFLIFWYADAGATNIIELDAVYIGTGFNTQFSMAAKGPYCQININATSGSATMSTYGSYKALVNNYYGCQGAGANNGTVELGGPFGVSTWSGVIPISTTNWVWQSDVIAGHCQLSLRFVGTGTVTMLARVPTNIASVTTYKSEASLAITATTTLYYDFLLPPLPFELSIQNPSATNTLTFRATLVSARPYST